MISGLKKGLEVSIMRLIINNDILKMGKVRSKVEKSVLKCFRVVRTQRKGKLREIPKVFVRKCRRNHWKGKLET